MWFPGTTLNYAEHIFRRRDTGAVAIIHGSEARALETCTWGELAALVGRVRTGLLDAGVDRGDRVAALMPNRVETLALLLATASIGAIFSCVAPEMGAASVVERFSQIEPTVLVAVGGYRYNGRDFGLAETVAGVGAALPTLALTVIVDGPGGPADALGELGARGEGWLSWDEFTAREGTLAFERVPFDDPLWILYSSGTTGPPKAIVHSQGGILLEHMKKLNFPRRRTVQETASSGSRTSGWMMWNFLVECAAHGRRHRPLRREPQGIRTLGMLWDVAAESGGDMLRPWSAGFLHRVHERGDFSRGPAATSPALRALGSTGSPLLPSRIRLDLRRARSPSVAVLPSSGGTDVCTSFIGGVPTLRVQARRASRHGRSARRSSPWDPGGSAP